MKDFQKQFYPVKKLNFVQPMNTKESFGRTYTVYVKRNQNPPTFIPLQPSPLLNTFGEIIIGVGLGAVVVGGDVIVAEIFSEFFSPVRNDEPMTAAMRRYIRERDDEMCLYCKEYAPNGHVDHRVSRANGGSNDPENLT
jgi:hypothetical protein